MLWGSGRNEVPDPVEPHKSRSSFHRPNRLSQGSDPLDIPSYNGFLCLDGPGRAVEVRELGRGPWPSRSHHPGRGMPNDLVRATPPSSAS